MPGGRGGGSGQQQFRTALSLSGALPAGSGHSPTSGWMRPPLPRSGGRITRGTSCPGSGPSSPSAPRLPSVRASPALPTPCVPRPHPSLPHQPFSSTLAASRSHHYPPHSRPLSLGPFLPPLSSPSPSVPLPGPHILPSSSPSSRDCTPFRSLLSHPPHPRINVGRLPHITIPALHFYTAGRTAGSIEIFIIGGYLYGTFQ